MASWVQIANLALSRLGTRQIADLGEASAEARAIVGVLATVCDSVLRAHPWNCALARAVLAADAAGPAFEYAYTYTLPTDPYCLRVLGIWNSTAPWMVEGRKLLTDHPLPLPLRYLRRVTDLEQLDGAFIAAFAERLAHAVCPVLTPSLEREGALWSSSERLVREARSLDGPGGEPAAAQLRLSDGEVLMVQPKSFPPGYRHHDRAAQSPGVSVLRPGGCGARAPWGGPAAPAPVLFVLRNQTASRPVKPPQGPA